MNPHLSKQQFLKHLARCAKKVRNELVSSGLDFTKMGYRLSFYVKMSVLLTGASWRADQVVSNQSPLIHPLPSRDIQVNGMILQVASRYFPTHRPKLCSWQTLAQQPVDSFHLPTRSPDGNRRKQTNPETRAKVVTPVFLRVKSSYQGFTHIYPMFLHTTKKWWCERKNYPPRRYTALKILIAAKRKKEDSWIESNIF